MKTILNNKILFILLVVEEILVLASWLILLISRENDTKSNNQQSTIIIEENSMTNSEEIKITATIEGKEYTINMINNSATESLLKELPLTLTFRDFQGQEKGATSPIQINTDNLPASDRGGLNDFIYYKPTNSLVFCYTDIGIWNGIIRLGTFSESLEDIIDLEDGFRVEIKIN